MLFKTPRAQAEWDGAPVPGGTATLSDRLKAVLEEIASYASATFDWELELASILRTPEENDALYGGHGDHLSGVHVVGRGADVHTLDEDQANVHALADWINARWIYDPLRPRMLVGFLEGAAVGAGSSAPHLHVQISPNTEGGNL